MVAVLGSGGGIRALTSFYGSLFGLRQLNLLDAVMYLCGISGSTWYAIIKFLAGCELSGLPRTCKLITPPACPVAEF